ncbi:MAG: transposase [Planctomyces sp.]
MARLARVEIFAADEVAVVHVMNRTVRRCFLLGYDPVSGRNYDHRKVWIDEQLVHQARHFGIDLLCQAIMSNHLHLVLRSRPDVVQEWSDEEVARRWLMLCPERRDEDRRPMEPTEFEINRIVNNKGKLASLRSRLSDISWWMRLLCQHIAQRANREDGEVGKFWQARYRAVRLLDEIAILSCAAYVDLNPIRAAMAQTISKSDFTSAQKRSRGLALQSQKDIQPEPALPDGLSGTTPAAVRTCHVAAVDLRSAQHLAPVELNERNGQPGPDGNRDGVRCSNKGFLPMSTAQYLSLLEWTTRQQRVTEACRKPKQIRRLFKRLGISAKVWSELVRNFGRLFSIVAGKPAVVDSHRSRSGVHRYRALPAARDLLTGVRV